MRPGSGGRRRDVSERPAMRAILGRVRLFGAERAASDLPLVVALPPARWLRMSESLPLVPPARSRGTATLDASERCPSARRSATGNRVRGESCAADSSPALSVVTGGPFPEPFVTTRPLRRGPRLQPLRRRTCALTPRAAGTSGTSWAGAPLPRRVPSIPLTCVLKPLHEVGLERIRVSTSSRSPARETAHGRPGA